MALGKRVFSGERRLILFEDSAIEGTTLAQWQEYLSAGCDESLLDFVEGVTPTEFRIRPLTPRQKDYIPTFALSDRASWVWRVRLGLVAISGYEVQDEHGNAHDLPPLKTEKLGRICADAVTEKWFADADLPGEHIMSIAMGVNAISEATAPLSQRSDSPSGAKKGARKVKAKSGA